MVRLVELLGGHGFELMDCQQTTTHLLRFGAREISRREFLRRLHAAVAQPAPEGMWRPRPLSAQSA
jgi:leucyl/phenylalanyl-tRNA--protein transferase